MIFSIANIEMRPIRLFTIHTVPRRSCGRIISISIYYVADCAGCIQVLTPREPYIWISETIHPFPKVYVPELLDRSRSWKTTKA